MATNTIVSSLGGTRDMMEIYQDSDDQYGGSAYGGGTAFAYLKGLLDTYGLGSLATWAWNQLVEGQSEEQILQSLYDQPEFRTRFSAIFARQEAGLPAISPAEVIAWERQATEMMRYYGMPAGFWDDPADFAELIGNDIGLPELEQRLNLAARIITQTDPETRQQLRDIYGFTDSQLSAMILDPDRGLQTLTQQYRASEIAGAAQRQQFGQLTHVEAEELASRGVDSERADQAFTLLDQFREITSQIEGESEPGMSRASQLGVVAGKSENVTELQGRQRRRQAVFEGGGGFAAGREGFSGLGSSS
jgi:hypothetical protein